MDIQDMNRILEWNPSTGVIKAEPGVTLQKLWQHVLPDGWWPPVVSGTMYTTLGGCLGMNIHGKNNYRMRHIGEHVVEFTALLPTGAEVTCSPTHNADLVLRADFRHGHAGGVHVYHDADEESPFRVALRPRLSGRATCTNTWTQLPKPPPRTITPSAGWIRPPPAARWGAGSCTPPNTCTKAKTPNPARPCRSVTRLCPPRCSGSSPSPSSTTSWTPFMNNPGVWLINTAKYVASLRESRYLQIARGLPFLLDYVPNWEKAYGRGGLIQYQSFLPKETAEDAWREMLSLSHKRGLPSYLGVTKRHRPDKFLLSHAVDGFSLALDFKVTSANRARLREMLQEFDRIVLEAGGRFYFAKNSETTPETALRFLGRETVERFKALKRRTDPNNLLESDLFRRVFGSL